MANYYADLDQPTRPGSSGAIGDPFGVTECRVAYATAGPHNFYLRGSGELDATITAGGAHTTYAWDVDLYGPWRMHSVAFALWNGGTFYDGIIDVAAVGGGNQFNFIRCHIVSSFIVAVGNVVECNLSITANVECQFNGQVSECVVNIGGAFLCIAGANLFRNNITNKANFAALAINAGVAPFDAGGNVYNIVLNTSVPAWNESDLQEFCMYLYRGVATYAGSLPAGDWAYVDQIYTSLSVPYANAPAKGIPAHPIPFDVFAAYIGPFALANQVYKLGGTLVLAGGIAPAFTQDWLTFDGYDLSDHTKADAWRINGMVGGLGGGAFDGNHYTFKRLALHQGTLGFNPANDNYTFLFKNCYLRHATAINLFVRYGMTMEWDGCTFYAPLINLHYCGLSYWTFNHCVFFDTVFSSDNDAHIMFVNCWFTTKTQAQVEAAIQGPVSFSNCHFAQPYVQFPPEVVDVNSTTMAYSRFALPYIRGVVTSLADWSASDYDYGFDDNVRQGYGAFYFALPTAGFIASPDHGKVRVEVQFIPNWTNGDPTAYAWDFGDGGTSNEQSPSHVYTMPGEWIPTLTVTFSDGSVVTVIGDPIYVYDYDYAEGVPDPTKTDTCYRTPVKPGDGFGPAQYKDGLHEGYDWVWPPARVGTAICYDEQNREKALVWDAKTQLRWLVNDPDCWEDRQGRAGYAGQAIISEIHHKADSANQGEHVAIVHTESHSYFRPYDVARIGDAGYDSSGYPNDLTIDEKVHVNGSPTEFTATHDMPKDGDIVFQERIEGRSIQMRKRISGAPWFYTGLRVDYDTIDKAARPTLRQMVEETWQLDLVSDPLFHVSRNPNPVLNLATGVSCTGGSIAALAVGPDGKDYSAILFATGATGLSDTMPADMTGNYTLRMWFSRTHIGNLPVRLWQSGTLQVRVVNVLGQRTLSISDGVNPNVAIGLAGTGLGWEHVAIVRDGLRLLVYENGVLLGTWSLTVSQNYGNVVSRCGGDAAGVFDACLVPRAVSVEALEYYYEDVLKGGRQVLPEY